MDGERNGQICIQAWRESEVGERTQRGVGKERQSEEHKF